MTDWKSIRTAMMKDNFIPFIVNFNTDDISNPDYKFENVNRASMVCGHMVKWSIA